MHERKVHKLKFPWASQQKFKNFSYTTFAKRSKTIQFLDFEAPFNLRWAILSLLIKEISYFPGKGSIKGALAHISFSKISKILSINGCKPTSPQLHQAWAKVPPLGHVLLRMRSVERSCPDCLSSLWSECYDRKAELQQFHASHI